MPLLTCQRNHLHALVPVVGVELAAVQLELRALQGGGGVVLVEDADVGATRRALGPAAMRKCTGLEGQLLSCKGREVDFLEFLRHERCAGWLNGDKRKFCVEGINRCIGFFCCGCVYGGAAGGLMPAGLCVLGQHRTGAAAGEGVRWARLDWDIQARKEFP